MSDVNKEDVCLESTLEQFGVGARVSLVRVQEAVNAYVAIKFKTNKATPSEIAKSFDALQRVYTVTLSTPMEHCLAAMNYLIRRFAQDRYGAFSAVRINMTPNILEGGSKTSLRFVADLNQLFGNLAISGTANQLRGRMRIEPVLANVRSNAHRDVIRQYIASIDF